MIIKTLFRASGHFEAGEVEVNLIPGIPQLHVVGLPDVGIREAGVRLKSALRACGLKWPEGQQIIVNLRPTHLRKSGSGADLAIALAFLALTRQLPEGIENLLSTAVVYGEISLDGRVNATHDLAQALRAVREGLVLTGAGESGVRGGRWLQWDSLASPDVRWREENFDWAKFWSPPILPSLDLHPDAARALWITTHLGLSVLVAGPQGSGKTTWARALYALSPEPDVECMEDLAVMFGERALAARWRPLEQPHHSITPQAMIGGGVPLQPGVISRAHGGLLVMDEFLEFHPQVLEALREPIENGSIEIARHGYRERLPARFQLVATTNLCPCGQLYPGRFEGCNRSLSRCSSVCRRLSGPLLDRFDLLLFSHSWLDKRPCVPIEDVRATILRMATFAKERGDRPLKLPSDYSALPLSHRRRRSLLRVARTLADHEESIDIKSEHFQKAAEHSTLAMTSLAQLFA